MKNNSRTDLAVELKDSVANVDYMGGIEIKNVYDKDCSINECTIIVKDKEAEEVLGKPMGKYITLESRALDSNDISIHKPMMEKLNRILNDELKDKKNILVVGLGNRYVTPDSIGPLVVDNLYITRHLVREGVLNNIRNISALAPGVMAQTGIETQIILKAICDEINPDIILAIDSLAAIDSDRLNRTIQICDTGISPGSGVGNNRARLDKESLGVDVIAIGVPTVISVCALVGKSVDEFINENRLDTEREYNFDFVNENNIYNMFVTPQNVDEAVKRISYTISEAINMLIY